MSPGAHRAPVRVLLANDRLGYEDRRIHGSGRLMVWWTRALLRVGVDVTSVILRGAGELGEAVRAEGLPFVFLDRHPFDPRTVFDFVHLIRQHRIEVLHLQGLGGSTFGRLAARWMGKPAVVHVHADQRREPKGYPWYAAVIDRLLAPHTSRVLSISEAVAGYAATVNGFHRSQVEVLPNPVDLRIFRKPRGAERKAIRDVLGIRPDVPVAICVARLDPIKGVDVLLDAWPTVVASLPEATLLLVGDGPQRPMLKARLNASKYGDRVHFLGYRRDVEVVLRGADVAIVPSRSEGFSLSALEAMATGLPVVATRVGGIPEVVSEGVNGTLVGSEDPVGLATAIVNIFREPADRREARKAAALATAAAHDLDGYAARLAELYAELA